MREKIAPWLRWSLAALTIALFCSGCSACADGELTTTPRDPEERLEVPGGTPTAQGYLMVPNGNTAVTVGVGQDVELGVLLFSKGTGDPIKAEAVRFEIVEGQGVGVLSAANSITDDAGAGKVVLRAQDTPGKVTVRASHSQANEVLFTADVLARATGRIEVKLTNTSPTIMDLKDIDVRLYEATGYSCNEFLPLRAQPQSLEEVRVANTAVVVPYEGLGLTRRYIVTAVARGAQRGQLAAAGCVEDLRVGPNETTRVELPLQLIPLNPVGRYEAQSYWDFSEAVAESGPVGSTIVRVLNIFQNPGKAIYDEVINLIGFAVGGIISGGIDSFLSLTGLDTTIQNTINTFIENNEVLRRVRDAGRDVRDVIANLHVTSELTIGKVSSSYEFNGMDNWLGVTLYWRWSCDATAPPECGAIPLLLDGTGDVANLGVLSSQWRGRVAAYDDLQIDQHPITLRYGRLIIYVLNQVIIPQLTNNNATSLSGAFAYWIGCDDLAVSITGSDREACALGACVYADDIANFCSSAIGTVFGFADALVRSLEFDIGLRVGGDAKLIEEDSDGFVDRIIDGTFNGFMSASDGGGQGTSAAPITATWEAVRIDFKTSNL